MRILLALFALLAVAYSQTYTIGDVCPQFSLSCLNDPITFSGESNAAWTWGRYDVIINGEFVVATGDTEGRVFAGSATIGAGYSIGYGLTAGVNPGDFDLSVPYGLVSASAAAEWLSGELYPYFDPPSSNYSEGIYSGGTNLTAASAAYLNDRVLTDEPGTPIVDPTLLTQLNNEFTNCFQTWTPDVTDSVDTSIQLIYQGLVVTCDTSIPNTGTSILFLDSATINAATWWGVDYYFTCTFENNFIIWVYSDPTTNSADTSVVYLEGDEFPNYDGRVLYYFDSSITEVHVQTSVLGSIVAPFANVYQRAGNVRGYVIALNYYVDLTGTTSEASQVSRPCITDAQSLTYLAPILGIATPDPWKKRDSSTTRFQVVAFNGIIVGDTVEILTYTATVVGLYEGDGKFYIDVSPALPGPFAPGTIISDTVDASQARTQIVGTISTASGAEKIAVSILALFLALIAALL